MLLLYIKKFKIRNSELFMHVKHVSTVTFCHLSNRYLSDVMKTSAKINAMQNINILLFDRSLSLTVKQGLIDHQASTQQNSDRMDRSHLNQKT